MSTCEYADPKLFSITASRLGCVPQEILMVGDSPLSDVSGALVFGM